MINFTPNFLARLIDLLTARSCLEFIPLGIATCTTLF